MQYVIINHYMANFNAIRNLAEAKGITLRELSSMLGISEDGLQKMMQKGSTKTTTLERLSEILDVPIGYFFDDVKYQKVVSANHGSAASINGNAVVRNVNRDKDNDCDKNKEIEHLKQLLEEKERTIKILMSQLNTKL